MNEYTPPDFVSRDLTQPNPRDECYVDWVLGIKVHVFPMATPVCHCGSRCIRAPVDGKSGMLFGRGFSNNK